MVSILCNRAVPARVVEHRRIPSMQIRAEASGALPRNRRYPFAPRPQCPSPRIAQRKIGKCVGGLGVEASRYLSTLG